MNHEGCEFDVLNPIKDYFVCADMIEKHLIFEAAQKSFYRPMPTFIRSGRGKSP
jgi:hypothetical protein